MGELSAAEILERVRETYATCETYVDDGLTVEVFDTLNASRVPVREKPNIAFKIRFRRSDGRLLFEAWEGDIIGFVAWGTTAHARSWSTLRESVVEEGSLDLMLGFSTVPLGLLANVPRLLVAHEMRGVATLDGFADTGEAEVDGVACRVLRRECEDFGDVETLFVGVRDHHIWKCLNHRVQDRARRQKMIERLKGQRWLPHRRRALREARARLDGPEFRVDSTTTFRPRFNVEIEDSEFEFEVPGDEISS